MNPIENYKIVDNIPSETWGPHYWYFLHTIAYNYPLHPNKVTKRKYYDLIINFPLFIPNDEMGNRFAELLDKYPVTPYLDNRESFIRWTWFIHNKINYQLNKEEIDFNDFIQNIKQYLYLNKDGCNKNTNYLIFFLQNKRDAIYILFCILLAFIFLLFLYFLLYK